LAFSVNNLAWGRLGATLDEWMLQSRKESDTEREAPNRNYVSGMSNCLRYQSSIRLGFRETDPQQGSTRERDLAAGRGEELHEFYQTRLKRAGLVQLIPDWQEYDEHGRSRLRKLVANRRRGTTVPAVEVPCNRWTITDPLRYELWRNVCNMGGRLDLLISPSYLERYAPEELAGFPPETIRAIDMTREQSLPIVGELKGIKKDKVKSPYYQQTLLDYGEQVQWYLWAFDLQLAILIVVNRENLYQTLEYVVAADYEYQRKELSRAAALELAVRTGVRAEAELHRGMCLPNNYCPYASDCPELAGYKKAQTIQRHGATPTYSKAPVSILSRIPKFTLEDTS